MIPRLDLLSDSSRSALALACATKVSPYFSKRFPDQAETLTSTLDECWRVVLKGSSINVNWDVILQEAEEAVPTSMDEPEAGPAIPAGEAALCALDATIESTPENTYEAISAAYTAVEMSSFLSMYPPDQDHGSIDVKELNARMKKVCETAVVIEFNRFLDQLIARVEAGAGPAEIRGLGDGASSSR